MPKENEKETESGTYRYLVMLLGLATVVLSAATVYMTEVLAINYGVGAGAVIQSAADKTNVTAVLAQTASQLSSLHRSVIEAYIVFLISVGMLGASFVLYTSRRAGFSHMMRRYTLLHTTLTLIYIAMFFIVFSSFQIDLSRIYFILIYLAMATAITIDLYLEFGVHKQKLKAVRKRNWIQMEPEKPYTNLIKLRDEVFASLSGYVRIVDKHFNSQAISNLHRLIETNLHNIKKLDVLTSKEMLDSKFQENYTDFKNELKNAGVELNFMLMSDSDSVVQHERFIFDNERAYKIPPLNIINKKSEHIVNLRPSDVKKRFESLARNSIKYDNYVVRRVREPGAT